MKAVWLLIAGLLAGGSAPAETGRDAWLRYAALDETAARQYRATLPAVVASFGDSPLIESARQELLRGVRGMLARTLRVEPRLPGENAIVIGTIDSLRKEAPSLGIAGELAQDGYRLRTVVSGSARYTVITAANSRGVLYGVFALLRKIAFHEPADAVDEVQTPYAPILASRYHLSRLGRQGGASRIEDSGLFLSFRLLQLFPSADQVLARLGKLSQSFPEVLDLLAGLA